jgi:hypothetical protein
MTLQAPLLQAVEQVIIGVQAAIFVAFFFASDGAAEIAIAITAMAPTSRTFAIDFMLRAPSVEYWEGLHDDGMVTRSILAHGG